MFDTAALPMATTGTMGSPDTKLGLGPVGTSCADLARGMMVPAVCTHTSTQEVRQLERVDGACRYAEKGMMVPADILRKA